MWKNDYTQSDVSDWWLSSAIFKEHTDSWSVCKTYTSFAILTVNQRWTLKYIQQFYLANWIIITFIIPGMEA